MTSRAPWLWVVLAGIAGCDNRPYYWRQPCDQDAAPGTCCPLGSHEAHDNIPTLIICAPDELPCGDAGADVSACEDAGADAR